MSRSCASFLDVPLTVPLALHSISTSPLFERALQSATWRTLWPICCLLNVFFLNLLMNAWARYVTVGTIAAMPKVYADDAGVLCNNCDDVDVAPKLMGFLARVTPQKLNVEKKKPCAPLQLHSNLQGISC